MLGKPVDHAETKAGALVHLLSRKEGLEGATADLFAHAGARVGHRYHHVITRIDGGQPATVSTGYVLRGNRQGSTRRHRVSRVNREVENGQFQLARLGHCPPSISVKSRLDFDRRPDRARQHLACFRYNLVDVNRLGRDLVTAREGKKLIGELCATLSGA